MDGNDVFGLHPHPPQFCPHLDFRRGKAGTGGAAEGHFVSARVAVGEDHGVAGADDRGE